MNLGNILDVGVPKFLFRNLLFKFHFIVRKEPIDFPLQSGVVMHLPLSNSNYSSEIFTTNGNVDWESERLLIAYLKARKDATAGAFYDVGAHIGYYSLLASPFVSSVHAFEPDPRNQAGLAVNVKRVRNMQVVEKAVGNRVGTASLCVGDESSVSHLASNSDSPKSNHPVAITTLDAFAASESCPPCAIKVDIEGFDIDAIAGAQNILTVHRPLILTEFGIELGRPNSYGPLFQLLEKMEYDCFAVVRHNWFWLSRKNFLKKLDQTSLQAARTKMLFLVPREDPFFTEKLGGV